MKKIIILSALAMIFLGSCADMVTQKALRTTSFAPTSIELKLTLDDFEYLGDDTVSVSYHTYFKVINFVHRINNKEIARRNVNIVQLYGYQNIPISNRLRRALFASHIKYPDAEFIVPVSTIIESQQMVFGSKNHLKLRVKVYKMRK
jgi:hypothetical protein